MNKKGPEKHGLTAVRYPEYSPQDPYPQSRKQGDVSRMSPDCHMPQKKTRATVTVAHESAGMIDLRNPAPAFLSVDLLPLPRQLRRHPGGVRLQRAARREDGVHR